MKRTATIIGLLLGLWTASGHAETVCLIRVDGTIGPATASYIVRSVDETAARGAQCLIIELDTPGGLLDSTKTIVQKMLTSPVPVVVYVAPAGAWAGSAGCFITMAADVAAMAPTTSIGAAHPVGISGEGGTPDDTMKQKLENFATSYMETIAARRHRNVEWAKSSVRESKSVTAEDALKLNVIDLIAASRQELLQQLDGRKVGEKTLKTAGASVEEIPMTVREKVFQAMWRPEMVYVLMIIVIYGIIGELSSPGAVLPGVVGAIALVLLLFMLSALPFRAAGLAMIGLAIALFLIDAFAPTHGVLTAGGVVAFFLGSLMMFDRSEPFLRISLGLIIPATVVTGLFFLFIVGAGLRAQRRRAATGAESIAGRTAQAVTAIDGRDGKVFFEGEYWKAVSAAPVAPGQTVEVVEMDGLTLKVKPKA